MRQVNKPAKKEKQIFLTEEERTEIWQLLEQLPKDEAEKFLAELDQEVIDQIRTAKNPYKLPVFKGNDNRLLVFTTIPLSETYAKRFAMTSLIGYIFRMVDEYAPQSITLPKEEDPEFQSVFSAHLKKLEVDRPYKEIDTRLVHINQCLASLDNLLTNYGETPTPETDSEGNQTWSSMNRVQLIELQQNYTAERLAANVERKSYNVKVNELLVDSLEVKLIGMKKKREEATALVERVEEIIKKFAAELKNLETIYAVNPEIEPDDRFTPDELKTRQNNISDSTMRSRKKVTETIAAYTTNLQKYREDLNAAVAQQLDIETRLAAVKDETANLRSEIKQLLGKKTKVKLPTYELKDEDYAEARRLTKEQLGIKKTYEEKTEKIAGYISEFLQEHFRYNPDNHVSCSYMPNYDDTTRTPLEVDEFRKVKEEEYSRSLLPPDDTFFRWQRYTDNNYEQLRQATDDIYCEKADLELNIVPMEVIDEADPEVAREKAMAFCRKYRNEFEAEVRVAQFRVNNLLGSWQQNRERIEFYNENTEVIKRIIDQHKKDSKMGPQLMKDRVERKRDKKIKVAGENDKAFKDFRKNAPSKLDSLGVKRASEILEKDIPVDSKPAGAKELEVGVHVIKPVRKGRRIYGKTQQSHFNIPAKDPSPDEEMRLTTASDRKKDFIDNKVQDE